jgi:hypothetical protein
MSLLEEPVGFGRGSAVREYWLSRCVGFRLLAPDGRLLGKVTEIETDGHETIVVCRRGFRTVILDVNDIDTVWPAHFLLVAGAEPAAALPGRRDPSADDTPTAEDAAPRRERARALLVRARAAGASTTAYRRVAAARLRAWIDAAAASARRSAEALLPLVARARRRVAAALVRAARAIEPHAVPLTREEP